MLRLVVWDFQGEELHMKMKKSMFGKQLFGKPQRHRVDSDLQALLSFPAKLHRFCLFGSLKIYFQPP